MTQRVQVRRSATPGEHPTVLLPGELAVNIPDGKLFVGDSAGTPIDLFTGSHSTLAQLLAEMLAENPALADQDMGGHKITNAAAGVAASDVVRHDQVIVGDGSTLWDAQARKLSNLAAGVAAHDAVRADQVIVGDGSTLWDAQGRLLTNLGGGTASDHAVRVDQVAWVRIGPDIDLAGKNAAAFALPAGYKRLRLEWAADAPAGAGVLYISFSTNGTSFDTGVHYGYTYTDAGAYQPGVAGPYLPLGNNRTGQRGDIGHFTLNNVGAAGAFQNTYTGNVLADTRGCWNFIGGNATHVLFAINALNFTDGWVRMTGWRT